jgi:L-fucose isomerase-like protein
LLRTGTTACLGVSYVNDCTDRCVSCEGDLDSAVTMLLMKKLTDRPLWMANPGLHPDRVINFNHCTSPAGICAGCTAGYQLRSHHESGIGVSLQVEMPLGCTVTACRISNEASQMTVHRGTTVQGPYEAACRTQTYVRLEDWEHYLDTALGCHQVFAFEDVCERLVTMGRLFGLQIL